MTLAWALILGFGLGLRHATDADHVVVIGTLLSNQTSTARAARLAALWGLGHTLTFLACGVLVVVVGVRVPERFERGADIAVSAMLMGMGAWTLGRLRRRSAASGKSWRPMLVGVVHGLAGSAGVALLALAAIPSRTGALAYLALFGFGTVAGMMLLTMLLALSLGWSARRYGEVPRLPMALGAAFSIAFGLVLGVRAVS